MLTTFRNHAKGWIAWVFVILITVPFAFWGIGQYRSLITTDYVAKVNGEKVMPDAFQRAYQQAYQQRQTTLGDKFNPTDKEQQALKDQVLDQLINQTLLRQQAEHNGLVASEADLQAQIAQVPAFQSGGHFDFEQYRAVLAANGYTTDQFEAGMRTDIAVQQLQNGLAQTAFTVPKEADQLIGLLQEQRKLAWFSLPLDHFKPGTPPTDKEIQAYYAAHQEVFSVPTTLALEYVRLGPKTLEARVKPSAADLESYYASHQNQYGIPPARKTAQILIKPAAAGTKGWAAAKTQAEQLLAEVRSAANQQKEFSTLAVKYSGDPISRRNGGVIGWIARGQMPAAFDQALFGIAKVDGIAGPLRTKDGWTLIQLLDERGGSVKPYAEIKQQVEKDYRTDKAKDLYFKLGDQLANIAYENPDSLAPVAKALKLQVQTLAGVTQDKGTGIASKKQIRAAAFNDSVLKGHQNSEPVKLGPDDAVVLRVSDVKPSHPKPLAAVHDEIAALLEHQQALAAAKIAAAGAVRDLQSGQKMDAVASALDVKAQGPSEAVRNDPKLPVPIVTAAFAEPPRSDGQPRFGTVTLKNGNQAVYAMLGVTQSLPDKLAPTMRQLYSQQLDQMDATQAIDDYVAWLRSHADIKIDKQNIP
ncbi:MAG: SurA N-terminal domain-containing protein [Gammaproteobacteria bacterium]